jgi:hypothetical protein
MYGLNKVFLGMPELQLSFGIQPLKMEQRISSRLDLKILWEIQVHSIHQLLA